MMQELLKQILWLKGWQKKNLQVFGVNLKKCSHRSGKWFVKGRKSKAQEVQDVRVLNYICGENIEEGISEGT